MCVVEVNIIILIGNIVVEWFKLVVLECYFMFGCFVDVECGVENVEYVVFVEVNFCVWLNV